MGVKRKPLSQKLRFEVFKRDSFTCQYCGRMAPDVVLEVDHIIPVAEGGTNEIANLVTSCKDCNRGKGKTLLQNHDVVKKSQAEMKELGEKRAQIEMMMQWKKELENFENDQVDYLSILFHDRTLCDINTQGRNNMKKLIAKYGLSDVYDSTEIAIEQYFDGSTESAERAFKKIGAICYNRKNQSDNPLMKDIYYLVKIVTNRFHFVNRKVLIAFMKRVYGKVDFDSIKEICCTAKNWTDLKGQLELYYGEEVSY